MKRLRDFALKGVVAATVALTGGTALADDRAYSRGELEGILSQAEINIQDAPELKTLNLCPTSRKEIDILMKSFHDRGAVLMDDKCVANLMVPRVRAKIQYLQGKGLLTNELESEWTDLQGSLDAESLATFIAKLDRNIKDQKVIDRTNDDADSHYEMQTNYANTIA